MTYEDLNKAWSDFLVGVRFKTPHGWQDFEIWMLDNDYLGRVCTLAIEFNFSEAVVHDHFLSYYNWWREELLTA